MGTPGSPSPLRLSRLRLDWPPAPWHPRAKQGPPDRRLLVCPFFVDYGYSGAIRHPPLETLSLRGPSPCRRWRSWAPGSQNCQGELAPLSLVDPPGVPGRSRSPGRGSSRPRLGCPKPNWRGAPPHPWRHLVGAAGILGSCTSLPQQGGTRSQEESVHFLNEVGTAGLTTRFPRPQVGRAPVWRTPVVWLANLGAVPSPAKLCSLERFPSAPFVFTLVAMARHVCSYSVPEFGGDR